MDINKWFEWVLPASRMRIYKTIDQKMYYYCDKGTLGGTCAYKDMSKMGIESISEEMIILLQKLSNLKLLNKKDWEIVKTMCEEFIDKEYIEILKYCKEKTIKDKYSLELDQNNDKLKKESIAMLGLNIEIQKQIINDKGIEKAWDIVKMILSAIFGSVITLLIKN